MIVTVFKSSSFTRTCLTQKKITLIIFSHFCHSQIIIIDSKLYTAWFLRWPYPKLKPDDLSLHLINFYIINEPKTWYFDTISNRWSKNFRLITDLLSKCYCCRHISAIYHLSTPFCQCILIVGGCHSEILWGVPFYQKDNLARSFGEAVTVF